MASNIQEDDLERMFQAILINTGHPFPSDNLDVLISDDFYLSVCKIIFPELNIKIMAIKENQELTPSAKIQKLIDLLSHELQLDLSSIKGREIIECNVFHLHKFLQVLEKFTQYHQTHSQEGSGSSRRVRSDPNNSQRGKGDSSNAPRSAREKIQQQMLDLKDDILPHQPQKDTKKKPKARKPVYSAPKKQKRNKTQARKNMYDSVVKIMMTQKNRTMSASIRDNRKVKNQEIIDSKNKYKAYLVNFAKQSRASKNRQNIIKNSLTNRKSERNLLPLSDIDNVSGLFKSFQYKLRDQKYCYLKRVQKLIKTQEVDRMCYLNKIEKEKNQQVKKSTKKELERIKHEHQIRDNLLKQSFTNEKEQKKIVKKEYEKFLRNQKMELKENKKKQMQKIKDFMHQENQKVLVNLSEGGRLEKVIMDMYKRF